ncbi:pilus assembly protein [Pseudomonas sp. nanlin1]|uniref:pilus assembly protein n=1 Tax=Pseudomonas sp. nanlin1 TaxID=3040605 RepID=UPI00388E1BA5
MRNNSWASARAWLVKMWLGVLGALYISAPVYAFAPAETPLVSAGAVTPNVMLMVDNSGSMNNLIRAADFDQSVARRDVYICDGSSSCSQSTADIIKSDNENVFYSSFRRGTCSFGYSGFTRGGSTVWCLKLPDPVGGGDTRYSARYIAYLIDRLPIGTLTKNYTDGSIPNDYRINVARDAATALVTANRNLRMGLATFNPPVSGNPGPGGNIARSVTALSANATTTAAQANTNYNALINAINGLSAIANTPLAETYYEVTRYFRGMAPYYNSTPSTYTSPIQYRCQKNYGVVITDGLPTYDRTFPTDDPLGKGNLPNWDGRNNDSLSNNLQGDGEGDTLYLDDIAKFANDIDMRTGGTDASGKSWDETGFIKQNMSTYTVGFTAANQMLSDAASYGQGVYYQASDADGLNTALTAALNDISSKAGSGGAGVASSFTYTSDAQYYETFYDPTDWRGTIKAFGFNEDGTVNTARTVWSTDDTIRPGSSATYESWNTSGSGSVIPLAYASFSDAQKTQLNSNLPSGITGANLVDWSKGTNRSGLKVRTVLLGDIINSPLVYASPNDQTASDSAGDNTYTTYLTTKSNMNPNLLVNSNDGFVNVISTSGARRYGFMPSSVLPNLYQIADPDYINGTSHKFLNDGAITVADAKFGTTWKTVAVGGVGAGGKSFYALQLFDATAGNSIKALWELRAPTSANAADSFNELGYAYAKPEIARLANGTWAAFISNGYGGNTGRAVLYVVNLATGQLINKITTPVVVAGETDNGLSSVKLSVNAQSVVQAAYGGDLKGRLWKFDFTSNSNGAVPTTPLFTASGGASQAITAQPVVGNMTGGRKLIYFGTGKLNEVADKTTTTRQAFYAILDSNASSTNYTESQLQRQTILNITDGKVYTSANTVDYTTQKGWYIPLTYGSASTGERVIYQADLVTGRIYFTTAILDTTDPCASSGSGKILQLDALNGSILTDFPAFGNRGISGILVNTGLPNISGFIQTAGGSTATYQDTSGTLGSFTEPVIINNRRIMWRQRQ